MSGGTMTAERLRAYGQAWNDRDVERILAMMTPDCRFHGSVGPELLGSTSIGRDAVRAALERFFALHPECEWADSEVFVVGDRGFSEWTLRGVDADGLRFEVRGCDLFEFDGDLVAVKNAFRKGN